MSTDVKTISNEELKEIFSHDAVCEDTVDTIRCTKPAEWLYVTRCCGSSALCCDEHYLWMINGAPRGYIAVCIGCRKVWLGPIIDHIMSYRKV